MKIIEKKQFWICAFFLAFALCVQRFLLLDHKISFHYDESMGIFQSTNLYLHGIFSTAPNGELAPRWDCGGTSGILSIWPTGLGFMLGKNLFTGRLFFQIYLLSILGLLTFFGFDLFKFQKSWPKILTVTCLNYLALLFSVNYVQQSAINQLGEVPGGLILACGFALLYRSPMLSAVFLGAACFLTKSLYFPFAALALCTILVREFFEKVDIKSFYKRTSKIIFSFFSMALLWNIVVFFLGGLRAVKLMNFYNQETTKSNYHWHFATPLEISWWPKDFFSFLYSRLFAASSITEWPGYALIDKVRILMFLVLPVVILLYLGVKNFRPFLNQRKDKLILYFGGSALFFVYTVWFFVLHRRMFIRHAEPILICGYYFWMAFIISYIKTKPKEFALNVLGMFLAFVLVKEGANTPKLIHYLTQEDMSQSYSHVKVEMPIDQMTFKDYKKLYGIPDWFFFNGGCQDIPSHL